MDYDDYISKSNYPKLKQVEEQLESNALLDHYIAQYKKKYKGEPIFPLSKAHLTTIKDIAKTAGPKAYEVIEHYFEMKEDWFIKQGHSLDCLLKNIQRIGAALSTRGAPIHRESTKMQLRWACDACRKEFDLIVPITHDFTKLTICKECEMVQYEVAKPETDL